MNRRHDALSVIQRSGLARLTLTVLALATTASPGFGNETHAWSSGFGSAQDDQGFHVTVDDDDNVYLTGFFHETVDFGLGPHTSAGSRDIALVKLAPDGTPVWTRSFGSSGTDQGWCVAADSKGNVWMTGRFQDTVDFGGGLLESTGGDDVFLAKYAPDGSHLFSASFGNSELALGASLTTDVDDVILTGSFQGTIDLGGGPVTSEGDHDLFIARFDGNGNLSWSRSFGGPGADEPTWVRVDDWGNVWVTGSFQDTVDLGGNLVSSAGSHDIFVLKLDSSGDVVWSASYGGPGSDVGTALATAADGAIYLTGWHQGETDFGGGELDAEGGWASMLVKLASDGSHDWSIGLDGPDGGMIGYDVRVDPYGNVATTGYFWGSVDLGDGPVTSEGGSAIYLAEYSSSGAMLWSRSYDDPVGAFAYCMDTDSVGDLVLTGFYVTTIDFGGGDLPSYGGGDIFVAKVAGAGPTSALPVEAYGVTSMDAIALPNPFRTRTRLAYRMDEPGSVTIRVFDVQGRLVETPVDNEYRAAGDHAVEFEPRLAAGAYFARIEAAGVEKTIRVVKY